MFPHLFHILQHLKPPPIFCLVYLSFPFLHNILWHEELRSHAIMANVSIIYLIWITSHHQASSILNVRQVAKRLRALSP